MELQLARVELTGSRPKGGTLLQPLPGVGGKRDLIGDRINPDFPEEVGSHSSQVGIGLPSSSEGDRRHVLDALDAVPALVSP